MAPALAPESAHVSGLGQGALAQSVLVIPGDREHPEWWMKSPSGSRQRVLLTRVADDVSGQDHEIGLQRRRPLHDLLEASVVGGEVSGMHIG